MTGTTIQPIHDGQPGGRQAHAHGGGMQSFSRALVGLYDLAEQRGHDIFLHAGMELLRPWLNFNGAFLWLGEIDAGLVLGRPFRPLPDLSAATPDDQEVLRAIDAPVRDRLTGLSAPLVWRWPESAVMLPAAMSEWLGDSRCLNFMLFGEDGTPDKPARWMLLYRDCDAGFEPSEAACLHGAWFHLMRATDLERLDAGDLQRAVALVTVRGYVIAADANFRKLLADEWPDRQGVLLPPELVCALNGGRNVYRGQRIEIVLTKQGQYVACRATALGEENELTPGEYMVARRYATGLSHKKIARELGVSPHTVRNQIAHLYAKLGIHDKAALAQYLTASMSQWRKLA
jgi:DNA-binding CsgD family transcriptional regulator